MNTNDIRHAYRMEHQVYESPGAARDAILELCDEVDKLRAANESMAAVLDEDLTFRDLEMKIRDGSVHINAMGSEEGGAPAYRIAASILFHMLLGEENELPPNYRVVEWSVKPGGDFQKMRLVGEIVRPDAQSSHEMRKDLEMALAAVMEETGTSTRAHHIARAALGKISTAAGDFPQKGSD